MTNIPKGNDKLGSPSIYISEHDLADEDIQVCIEALGLEEVLYQIGFNKEHLPIGLQIIGDSFEEAKMYQLAGFIEKELNLDLVPEEVN